MALSFYSNWGTLQHLNPETNSLLQEQAELAMEILGFQDSFSIPNTSCFVPLFDPDDIFLSENLNHLLPCLSPPLENSNSLTSELFLPQEFEPYSFISKRQKSYDDLFYSDFTPRLINGFVPNPPLLPEFSPRIHSPLLDFHSPPAYYSGIAETEKKINYESVSGQSIAARLRRKKITEKTQELGKLIPGGQKMNTAEMFQAAFKYIKYLQAQVRVFELMEPIQEIEEPFQTQELQALASSPCIQEKLYSSEKCLIPTRFVQTLANDCELQSNPVILTDLNQLIRTCD